MLSEFRFRTRSNCDVLTGGRCFIFADVYDNKVHRFFNSDTLISAIRSSDYVWAFEVALLPDIPEEKQDFVLVYMRIRTKSTSYYVRSNYSFNRFAPPRMIAVQRKVTSFESLRDRLDAFVDSLKQHLGHDDARVSISVLSQHQGHNDEGDGLPTTGIFPGLQAGASLSVNFLDIVDGRENALPLVADGSNRGGSGAIAAGEVSLESCIEAFQKREELSRDDWVFCSKSKDFERSFKKLDIWNLPEVFIIHLKRFGRERMTGPLEKIDTLVDLPMKLDLAPYLMGSVSEGGAEYVLHAIVNHMGRMGGGHYTAHARVGEGSERQWYHFNDSSVSRVSDSEVVSNSAYIAFYERITSLSM